MANVAISAAPNIKVSGLAIKRTNAAFRATWKVPAAATQRSNKRRWTGLRVTLKAHTWSYSAKKGQVLASVIKDLGAGYESYTLTLTEAQIKKIFPQNTNVVLTKVTCDVQGYNSYGGKRHYGPKPKTAEYNMAVPAKPSLSLEYDAPENKVTAKWDAVNQANATSHRYDTVMTVKRSGTGGSSTLLPWEAKTWTSRTWPGIIENSGALTTGQWIRVDATAHNRGWRGNGADVTKTVFIAHPSVPLAKEPVVKFVEQGVYETASVLVPIDKEKSGQVSANGTNVWPETLFLQRLRNSSATTPTEASQASGWEGVDGAEATGQCTGLMDPWADAAEEREPGKHFWYRIVAQRDGYTQYGVPVEARCLYVPSAEEQAGDARIGTIVNGGDGESLIVPVSWTQAENDGVELSWSIHEDAWRSNEKPSTLDVDWGSGLSATATIRGLAVGVPVFIRARCFNLNSSEKKVYGAYSDPVTATPYDAPEDVKATVPSTVLSGREIPVEWTFGSDSPQQWADILIDGTPIAAADGGESDSGHTVTGSAGAVAVPSDELALGTHTITVIVSTDGAVGVESLAVEFRVTDAPTGSISVNGIEDTEEGSPTSGLLVITSQPLEIILDTDSDAPVATVAVVADGIAEDEMHDAQASGGIVWNGTFSGEELAPPSGSTEFSPTTDEEVDTSKVYYELVDGAYTRVDDPVASGLSGYYEYIGSSWAMTAPENLDLRDGGGYSVRCSITDSATGLSAALEPAIFAVKWAHQAVEPEGEVAVDDSALTATVTIPAPSGYAATDVIDLYRVTPGGSYLIATGRPFEDGAVIIVDPYAPFRSRRSDAELRYRAVLRTVDGDMEFYDMEYSLVRGFIRLDWDGGSVELPYNVNHSDSFAKDFASRVHADGSVGGFWSPAVEHRASLSTDLIRIASVETREALLAMARYAGPVFVRTPDGMAFCSDANLGSLEYSYNSMAIGVSLDATEVGIVDSFLAVPLDEEG